jgi:hypothetical protein
LACFSATKARTPPKVISVESNAARRSTAITARWAPAPLALARLPARVALGCLLPAGLLGALCRGLSRGRSRVGLAI